MLRQRSCGERLGDERAPLKEPTQLVAPKRALYPPPSLVLVLLLPAAISGVVILAILSQARKNDRGTLSAVQASMHWPRRLGGQSGESGGGPAGVEGVGNVNAPARQSGQSAGKLVDAAGVANLNVFSAKLLQEVTKEVPEDVFVSPVSVAALCGMALSGTDAEGEVAGEFQGMLGSSARALGAIIGDMRTSKDSRVDISLANSAWVAGNIRKEYLKEVGDTFYSQAYPLPSSAAPVNQWVAKATNGLISEIIEEIDPTDVALLVNAVFFKGAWKESFQPEDTVPHPFQHPLRGELNVDMMMQRNVNRKYGTVLISTGTLRLLEIPYGSGDRYAAVVVLPSQGASVADAVKHLASWDTWVQSMRSQKVAAIGLPRFRVSFGAKSVKTALQGMGLQTPWKSARPDQASHFPLLSEDQTLYISDIVHRAVVEVTEEGTVAAAAGAMTISRRSASGPPMLRMIVDEPFLFAIRDIETGLILFLGKVDQPKFA